MNKFTRVKMEIGALIGAVSLVLLTAEGETIAAQLTAFGLAVAGLLIAAALIIPGLRELNEEGTL